MPEATIASDIFVNYYEVLGIPPNANNDDLTRVYHLLAARYHPDNIETGDLNHFLEVKTAFEILSDPEQRKEFDRLHREHSQDPLPIFLTKSFTEGVLGENNRRLGILCLLYNQRKLNPGSASLSVLQLESMMCIPREHLDFTTWYLKQKKYVTPDDRSSLTITSDGIDFVEENLPREETVRKLLKADSRPSSEAA
jgi:curved DNA-binding protein CbpA